MKGIDGTTLRTLRKFVAQGGKLYLAGQCPTHVDGEEARVGLVSNIGFEDLKNTACYIDNENTEIRSTLRRAAFGDFIYAVNLSETETYEVAYTAKAPGARKFDLEERNYAPVYYEKTEDGVKIPLCLKPGDSVVIMLDEGEAGEKVCLKDAAVTTGLTGKIVAADKNTLTLDYAALSYDGVEYTDMLPIMAVSDRLLRGKTDQKVYLKFRFTVAEKVAVGESKPRVSMYSFEEKLKVAASLTTAIPQHTLVKAGSFEDVDVGVMNEGNVVLAAFDIEMREVEENGVEGALVQTIHVNCYEPEKSKITMAGDINPILTGKEAAHRAEDFDFSPRQRDFIHKEETVTYSMRLDDNFTLTGSEVTGSDTKHLTSELLMSGSLADIMASFKIPDNWSGQKKLRLRIVNAFFALLSTIRKSSVKT